MPIGEPYRRQVALLVEVLPLVAQEECFALKGGTAINLFHRDMPRLSVDIDLTYLPIEERDASLAGIDAALRRIADAITAGLPGTRVTPAPLRGAEALVKLTVRRGNAQIKIEVTPVLRGCAFPPERRAVVPQVEDAFGFAEMPVVSFADLYAGKIVAALDRQHPRDLFDVRLLLANEGIDDALRRAFVVYIVSHHRPMAEVLAPPRKDLSEKFLREFIGMTDTPIDLDALVEVRERLIAEIVGTMPPAHKALLLGFERGAPDWGLIGMPEAARLPAVRWRETNLATLSAPARDALVQRLADVLRGG